MKLKKLLPIIGSIAATSAVIVPLTTSCSKNKAAVFWKLSDGTFQYKTDVLPEDTDALNNDGATKKYFSADDAKQMYAEDIANLIITHEEVDDSGDSFRGWLFTIPFQDPTTTNWYDLICWIPPSEVKVEVSEIDYHDATKLAVVSAHVEISGTTDVSIYDESSSALEVVGSFYSTLTMNYEGIDMCVSYNQTQTQADPYRIHWNVDNKKDAQGKVGIDTDAEVEMSVYVPALAKQWKLDFEYEDLKGLSTEESELILGPISTTYTHYLTYVEYTADQQ